MLDPDPDEMNADPQPCRKVNLKIPINSGIRQAGIARPRKMTLCSWFHQTIFSGLPRCITKSRKMTFRGLANSGLS
jgi:hypothetical protein